MTHSTNIQGGENRIRIMEKGTFGFHIGCTMTIQLMLDNRELSQNFEFPSFVVLVYHWLLLATTHFDFCSVF